jgi:dynein heavy chain
LKITGVDKIIQTIDDQSVSIQTMLGTKFVTNIRDKVEFWDKKVCLISHTIEEWLNC